MNPALWGMMTALGWGSADFIARFTGRAMGHETALLGMLGVGALVLPVIVWQADVPWHWQPAGWWLLLLTGVGVMVATLLLYWGLARGPVTVVAPIVGSYPALNLALAVILGTRPTLVQWLAMAVVLIGVVTVAVSARSFEARLEFTRGHLRTTVTIALGSSLGFAVTVAAAQAAEPIYGQLQTVCIGRWISLLAIGLVFAWRRRAPRIHLRWWPWLTAQGLLDGGAYIALLAGSQGPRSAIAVVVASSFSAVTVVLARLILRELMTWLQWGGIVLIVAGVGTLSWYGET
ncbi:MAG: EamA family transporter [Gammaproteobacteria bacterium]|nr:EamA family transporter [Gammaproteobacteria bacterium]NIR82666.1 EamA family transporter [Gammaproteobacteria bacterium]NIR89373.1 EamA family transporter [Gammaproteobacteria bacterium]NIU03814.1 EamA family transporter [Gammaproteobacteria bacterium]NIV51148.1 EamA family transporter [Gammaproteobacteria bacterium]